MVSIFDAVVLDWWMFTKTDIFGLLIKAKTGRTPDIMRVDPQWDGKEFLFFLLGKGEFQYTVFEACLDVLLRGAEGDIILDTVREMLLKQMKALV